VAPARNTELLDFGPLRRREVSLQELAEGLTRTDLARLTDEMCDVQLEVIAHARDRDVVFMPIDDEAEDRFAATAEEAEMAWTLSHVVVHATASSEESAALALDLARGVEVSWRSRFEVDWRSITTVAACRQRIRESRRMRQAMLSAWPREPHLENFYSPFKGYPALNALGRFIAGPSHDDRHIDQMRKILDQSSAAGLH
jgi:hypothetical protein